MAVSLREFIPFRPDEILSGPYADWALLILFCGLFIAIAGAVLPKHLSEKRYGKAVVVFAGIILGIGLFKAKEIYHFNLESFGFFAIWLIIILMGFVAYGLIKMGMAKGNAIALTYCVIFLSFFFLSPSLFDSISASFPLINLIFIILFIYMLTKFLMSVFRHDPLKKGIQSGTKTFKSGEDIEVEKEQDEDEKEINDVKRKTIPAEKKELKTLSHTKKLLEEIIESVNKSGAQLSDENKKTITEDLKSIYRSKVIIEQSIQYLCSRVDLYKKHHMRDITEVQQRLTQASSEKQKKALKTELRFHKIMLDVISFIEKFAGNKEPEFIKSFNSLLYTAIKKLKEKKTSESLGCLQALQENIKNLEKMLRKIKSVEKRFIKTDKKIIKNLKSEKKV